MSSSSKKRTRKKKQNSLADFADKKAGAKNLKKDGIDVTFMMLGMITTLLIGLLVYSQLRSSPGAGRALAAATSGEASDEVNSIGKDEFQELVENGNKTQLQNVLKGLNQQSGAKTLGESIKRNQRRIDVANKMITMQLNSEQRRLSVGSKIDAMEAIYGLEFQHPDSEIPNVTENLRNFANVYRADPDATLGRRASLSLFKIDAFEAAKEDTPDIEKISDDMCALMENYPNDDAVLSTIAVIMEHFRVNLDRGLCERITSRLESRKQEFTSPKVLTMIADFSDESKIAKAKYRQLFENRWLDGTQGQQELLKRSIELGAGLDSGRKVIKEVDRVAHWFEQESKYESSRAIYEAIANAADNYNSPEVAAFAKQKAVDGQTRISLVGNRLDFTARKFNGEQFPKQLLENKVVIVVFWSMHNKTSVLTLKKIAPKVRLWREKGIRVLAVNVDRTPSESYEKFANGLPSLSFVGGDPTKNYSNNILMQCPSSLVPRIMLVNRDGTVADISTPLTELETEVDFLSQD